MPPKINKRVNKLLDKEEQKDYKALKAKQVENDYIQHQKSLGNGLGWVPPNLNRLDRKRLSRLDNDAHNMVESQAQSESSYEPEVQEQKQAKTKKKKRLRGINPEDQALILQLCDDYMKSPEDLDLEQHSWYMSKNREEKQKLRKWYLHKHRKAQESINKGSKLQVPQIENPNEIMINLLSTQVEEQHRPYLAQILADHLPANIQRYYANKELQNMLEEIQKCETLDDMKIIVERAPLYIRLKATARALTIFEQKIGNNKDENFKFSWFQNCIKPALGIQKIKSYSGLSSEEVQSIRQICQQNPLYLLTDQEALSYLTLLKEGNMIDLDEAIMNFIEKSYEFWLEFLAIILKINREIAEIWAHSKGTMITQALYMHYRKYSMDLEFARVISKFPKLNSDDISELLKLQQYRNFSLMINLLGSSQLHDFHQFKAQSEPYLKLEKPAQKEACKSFLSRASLDTWHKYRNSIMASEAFIEQEESYGKVKDHLYTLGQYERIAIMTQDQYEKLEYLWREAFENLNKHQILQEFRWQKELVIYLAYLVLNQGKKNIVIGLGTGHGKSVVIQLLAEMLSIQGEVFIVCLNEFLAYWGRSNYGTQKVQNQRIIYLSLDQFIKRKPNGNQFALFDEIDQMLGKNSLSIVDNGGNISAVYRASLMKLWKTMIGFSGTVSQSTISQLRAELKDPLLIQIPSLRIDGCLNKLSKVIQVKADQKSITILKRLDELQNQYSDFVIIFDNKTDIENFMKIKEIENLNNKKNVLIFDDFTQNFSKIVKNLKSLTKDNFVVITTKEGGRGIDFKGINTAHVIIAFEPESFSQCVQALGRGSRELMNHTEGTIICQEPLTLDAGEYLDLLNAQDDEHAQAQEINCKIARMLHGKSYTKVVDKDEENSLLQSNQETAKGKEHFTITFFSTVMRKNENIQKMEQGQVLWNALRVLDTTGRMPEDPFQEWKQ